MILKKFGAALLAACGMAGVASADAPFSVTSQSTSGPAQTINVSGSSLPNLLDNVLQNQSQFASLANQGSTTSIAYGGVDNAILISRNAAGTSATVSLPEIGFTKTFTGTSPSDLDKQIKDFAKKNGADIYGNFIRAIDENSEIGVVDGNPLAATAIFADQAYTQFGLNPAPFQPGGGMGNPLDSVATPNIRLDLNGGYAHTDASSSYFAGGDFSFGFKFGQSVGLVFSTPFNFRDVDGASVYMIGEDVSLPIVLIHPSGNAAVSWMLTPTFFAGGAGSVDLAAGGLFMGGGITSSLSVQLAGFIFTLADSFDYFHGFPITVGDYKFETNLDQDLLKNGVKVTKYFGGSFFIDGGISYTNFLQRAAISEYWSPEAGLGLRLGSNVGLRVGYAGDFARDYVVHGGDITLYFNF